MSSVLALTNVSKRYGALKVTDDISFEIEQGETLGILGPNGAGKTTLFNLVSGDVRPDAGTIHFDGNDIGALAPHRRCIAGIGRVVSGAASVRRHDGVREPAGRARPSAARLPNRAAYDVCIDVLKRTGLERRANQLASTLTLLDRKRLELARALATRPKLLLLDEIAGGLTEPETHELVDEIKRMKEQGVTIIWIEHVVHALLAVADRLLVIHFGKRLAEGKPAAVMDDPEVRRVYIGTGGVSMSAILETRALSAFYGDFQALFGVDVTVNSGEVVALIGSNGAGKSTFLKTLAGLLRAPAGQVVFKGEADRRHAGGEIVGKGIALVPEGRRLFASLSVEENLLLGGYCARPGRWNLQTVYELFPALKERRRHPATALSGGQQQMVAIGRALMSNPDLHHVRRTLARPGAGDRAGNLRGACRRSWRAA